MMSGAADLIPTRASVASGGKRFGVSSRPRWPRGPPAQRF